MLVPSMLNMADVMAKSGETEEYVFDLGITGAIVFLVVVPLMGACRVPVEALSHFMAGADDYTAEGMPEHWSGALSGTWAIKRDRLRILESSWNEYSYGFDKLVEVVEQVNYQKTPEYQAQYRAEYNNAVQADIDEQSSDLKKWKEATSKDAAYLTNRQQQITALTASIDALTKTLLPTESDAAPVMAVGASGSVESDKPGPLPLTTGDIAYCFAGLRWNELQWKKPLGDKPKWLVACIAIPGLRGVSETRWNPVLIGAALERQDYAKQNSIRAKFQTMPQLAPWRDAWKTYEADNFDTE